LLWLLVVLIGLPALSNGQLPAIDSIRQKITSATTDKDRLHQIRQLLLFRNSLKGDTMQLYANGGKLLAIKLHDEMALGWCNYYLLAADLANGKSDMVLYEIDKVDLSKMIKSDAALYFKMMLLKANALNRKNERTSALELQLKILSEAENMADINARAYILNYIGATYLNIGNGEAAKGYWLQGLTLVRQYPALNLKEIEAYLHSNLALYYFILQAVSKNVKEQDSFLLYTTLTIRRCKEISLYSVLANMLVQRGNFYGSQGNIAAGEKDIIEGIAIRKKVGDPYYVIDDMISLAGFYFNQKKYDDCIAVCDSMMLLARANGIVANQPQLFTLLSAAYNAKGNFEQYSRTLEQYIAFNDSASKINAAEKIAEVETKYQLQKKEVLIATQKLELWRKNIVLYSTLGVGMAILIFSWMGFRQYRRSQKAKMKMAIQEEQQQKAIAIKNAEENERKRIAAELHDNMGIQANAILHNSNMLGTSNDKNEILVSNLQFTAREMLGNLRETVWALKATEVCTIDTWHRIVNFVKSLERHYPSIYFKVYGEPPNKANLSSVKALHIVMVIKEAVNNAIKHASAKSIAIASKNIDGAWKLTVADDGIGFDAGQQMSADNNGLQNMKQRASEASFVIEISTDAGKGTLVSLLMVV
jgi:two-component system, NarL family, sensor kinase